MDADRRIKQNEGCIEELYGNLQSSNPRGKFQLQGKNKHNWHNSLGGRYTRLKISVGTEELGGGVSRGSVDKTKTHEAALWKCTGFYVV